MLRTTITIAALGLAVCACGQQTQQRPAIDPRLDSGVTSSNGGGQRATGATPNIPLGTSSPSGPQQAPSNRGAAY